MRIEKGYKVKQGMGIIAPDFSFLQSATTLTFSDTYQSQVSA